MTCRILLDGALENPELFKVENAKKQKSIQHVEWVKKNVPKERLLVLELGMGWSQLCQFLNMSQPGKNEVQAEKPITAVVANNDKNSHKSTTAISSST
ncbi:hypothetical protein BDA99DRAFT_565478 [Phascolomyces articulosus]|uniref:Uncharacterized protein n=1 Tax=Phascolomyces articulosus TaxID=60185 RepID=A0AAD5JMQ2_9FUNG|nr:hypothetical protein BDA99DRAFT_565478 [Phascolomyces articulosus]